MKIKKIVEKYGISAKSISEYITFYETHRDLVDEEQEREDDQGDPEEDQ